MRADARRNREKLLAAARQSFAAEGLSVPVDEIARRAGLGAGTMHRHFPTKESLFEAIVLSHVDQLVADALSLADADDPGEAFFGFCLGLAQRGTDNRGLAEILAGAGVDAQARIAAGTAELDHALSHLVRRAQAAGRLRTDLAVPEILALLSAVHTAADRTADSGTAPRLMAVICDGLRVRTAT
jgi:AcrR family transcriptional regulator